MAADCSKAVVGYVTGNLLISVIAGALTYAVLWIMGVPYKGVVALFVGFADLIPLVGATLGAIAAVAVAALHSLPAAIVVLVFFVVYQQVENHLLQPLILSRTVQLSALAGVSCCGWVSPSPARTTAGAATTSTRTDRIPALWHKMAGAYQAAAKTDRRTAYGRCQPGRVGAQDWPRPARQVIR